MSFRTLTLAVFLLAILNCEVCLAQKGSFNPLPQIPKGSPPCFTACIEKVAQGATFFAPNATGSLSQECQSTTFQQAFGNCLQSSCNAKDLPAAQQSFSQLCSTAAQPSAAPAAAPSIIASLLKPSDPPCADVCLTTEMSNLQSLAPNAKTIAQICAATTFQTAYSNCITQGCAKDKILPAQAVLTNICRNPGKVGNASSSDKDDGPSAAAPTPTSPPSSALPSITLSSIGATISNTSVVPSNLSVLPSFVSPSATLSFSDPPSESSPAAASLLRASRSASILGIFALLFL